MSDTRQVGLSFGKATRGFVTSTGASPGAPVIAALTRREGHRGSAVRRRTSALVALLALMLVPAAAKAGSQARPLVVRGCTMPSDTHLNSWSGYHARVAGPALAVTDTITTGAIDIRRVRRSAVTEVRATSVWCPTGRVRGSGVGFCELN
jgi:hypothetical protein